MYRTALRSASRPVIATLRTPTIRAAPRRFASSSSSSAPSPRSWKGSAVRWGLAFGAVYYYNTSPVFADEVASKTVPAPAAFSNDDLPTVDSVLDDRRRSKSDSPAERTPSPAKSDSAQSAVAVDVEGAAAGLDEDAGQQGAFNPETGEINWDCPCLGGMADGPCGEEFKTAFSCFVYSTEEPKGMDCIEKFQGMQECFKKYPEIYGAELADDEDGAPTPDFGDKQPVTDAQKTAVEPTGAVSDQADAPAPTPVQAKEDVQEITQKKDVAPPQPAKE